MAGWPTICLGSHQGLAGDRCLHGASLSPRVLAQHYAGLAGRDLYAASTHLCADGGGFNIVLLLGFVLDLAANPEAKEINRPACRVVGWVGDVLIVARDG